MIRLENVSKSYAGKGAVADVTLALNPETTTALIGPSGCGKSTLLRMILGLVAADSGNITIGETAVTEKTRSSLRQRIGYVIQDGGLFPHLTAGGNVSLMARHLGWDRARLRSRLAELSELTQLPVDLLDRYPAQLSGGQRQRVGLMRGLMLDPQVLLLDEPLGALDPIIRTQLQEDLRGIFQRLKKTVLLVTHDMAEATFLGDQIVLMREGRIIQQGSSRDLVERPADPFVVQFIQAQRPPWLADEGANR
jgi:osmoprotectant transport system ATP-binding protein